ncbi:glycine-rich cell wall structural protein 2-like [Lolium rigidum]|uniref:glycine-rich cell wall structural protein 2-like n=1 Tax=Lolium rigidum TaxID=89674 RepID=UPI001F5C8EC6|nr:glycine-rich cell wall structural protein 2-like [Lolium rigidum]
MVKQKIVLKLALDDERKRRKAFKAAVSMAGVTSATMEGDKIIIVGDGVDPITLTTVLRRGLGYAELLSVSSGDDKKKDGYGAYGYGGEKQKDGYGAYGYGGEKQKDGYGTSGYGGEKKKNGHGYGGADGGGSGSGMSFGGKESGSSKGAGGGGGGYPQNAVAPVLYPAYQQYNAMPPSYPPVYSYPAPAYQHQEQDPGCSIM